MMLQTPAVAPDEQHFILSTLSPSAAQKWLAAAVICSILVVYIVITVGPIKGVYEIPAFVPAYVTAMFACDFITALLLYAQFAIVRSRATLVVASAYLFAALVMIPFILVFPNVFEPGKGLLGGQSSTSWVYFFAHAGFPLFILRYAFLNGPHPERPLRRDTAFFKITRSVILTVALVFAGAFLFIAGEPLLPRLSVNAMTFGVYWWYPAATVVFLNVATIIVLWFRQRAALDLWLMVVMFLYAIEIPLTYYPEPHRFSVAWYAVRCFGVLSSSIVLMLLIHEIETLYARLLGAIVAQRRERDARLLTGDAVAAAIAHEVKQPLTAMVTSADAGARFLDRSLPNLDKAKEAFKHIAADGHRAAEVIESIRATFKNDVSNWTVLNVNELIHDTLALEDSALRKHQILVEAEATPQLPEVQGDRIQLQQVLLNLITNAIDAMATKDEPRVLSVKSEAYQSDGVMVSVGDTGIGIGRQDSSRIFNPLFTTKSAGMGMGLSICRSIIEAHEGRLWVAPNIPHGSVFQFTLHGKTSTPARA
jgi:signal transduction histidine kinase